MYLFWGIYASGRFVFENEKNVSEADEWTAKAREEGCAAVEKKEKRRASGRKRAS